MRINDTINTILNHRSIRKWSDKKINEEIENLLYEVAMKTATSTGMQAASIIKVDDIDKKKRIAKVCKQDYIADAPLLLVFIIDNYRNYKIVEESGQEVNYNNDVDRFFAGYTDAAIMAQNVVNAAESLGLGTVYLGSILNDVRETINILELPKYTMPVVGLAIGYPGQEPALKPRMDKKLRVFTNKYKKFKNYHEKLKEYDEVMNTYYDLRNSDKPLPLFTNQVVKRASSQNETRQKLLKIAKEQGFDFE